MPGSKEKACMNCRRITTGNECDNCGSTNLTTNYSGLIIIIDPEKSEIARELGLKKPGAYATKT
ncbi:MAG: DNA-directed RNA polymerase, subunit E'' [Thaumarchaeota archaeon]|jgi:DNA-directed RNA polymerase subunit E"|nr:DNA-directed RNA polymerase, subunit E'' [Candidatus Geocrenenecus arthurdayi]MCL7389504.1 DNA-directed RNA polymerase, subunit E'' [Candidatus Geocrenenecus arthurdayi]MCL7391139.1 DNA-directed RNA polymerase, subunit E'' [Candidatus Geocrenenecus arthurdayi]MCL7397065.1 DNA-directed RNA polymerase, subunit E'' [Candidatus Geocrenenecus arthurdayi]MCL7402268.1 DNA-directed RNA polymerase, subunit E'' [Candidatus Geocrenenecus arthurdayi]